MLYRPLLAFFAFSVFIFGLLPAQGGFNPWGMNDNPEEDGSGAEYSYCNMFYVKSSDTTALPFNDICFVNDIHEVREGLLSMRYVGPVFELQELFVAREWGMTLILPLFRGEANFPVTSPAEVTELKGRPPLNQAFVYLSHNQGDNEYEYESIYDRVDFRGVSGKISIHPLSDEQRSQQVFEGMEYEANLEVFFQPVVQGEGKARLSGERIRVKSTFYIKSLAATGGDN